MAESIAAIIVKQLANLIDVARNHSEGGLLEDLEFIKGEFERMTVFLRVADAVQDKDPEVAVWVKQVREIAHDAQDVLDEYDLLFSSQLGHVRRIFSFIKNFRRRSRLATELHSIKSRVHDVSQGHQRYRIRYENQEQAWRTGMGNYSDVGDVREAAHLQDEADLVGIQRRKGELISKLLDGDSNFKLISVVGMGGLGKTTLVKKVYEDKDLKSQFQFHAWVTVSATYNIKDLLKSMIDQFFRQNKEPLPQLVESMNSNELREFVRDFLQGRKYLIVLDDVWDINLWDAMKYALCNGSSQSRVMLTTRSKDVAFASSIDSTCIYELKLLSPDESWELFCNRVFKEETCPSHLKDISERILSKCEGLPLAIVAIGGILALKDKGRIDDWEVIYRGIGVELEGEGMLDKVKRILPLRFFNLPHQIEVSLQYLSIFPEDHRINCNQVIRLWIAEGFIEEREGLTVEEVGMSYVNKLVNAQNQLIGQPNSIPDLQQQQQRLMSQQNNISNLQQQQLIGQQNNLSNIHQSQLGPQSSVSGLQQSQMLGTQSGNSGIPANQHSVHMIQQKVPVQQQMQHANLVPNQAQQSQTQPSQQQMMSQIQSQNGQLQHLQQQSNPMQRDIQQRLQNSGALLQHQNVVEQQKQLFQSQRAIPEASSTSLDSTAQTGNTSGGDWQEEVYQKIKAMKEMYFTELNEMYSKIAAKLQQHESVSQQTKNEQLEKLKMFKHMLERLVQFLRLNKNDVQIGHKEKLGSVEKQIVSILNSHRPRKHVSLQQGQHPQPHMQPPQAQSQISQMQSHENQMNPQMQSMNVPSSVATMQQNNLSGLQHNSLSSVPAVSNSQQSMINAMQPALNPDGGQSSALNSMQQVTMSSLQQNPVSGPQSVNISSLTSQGGMNTLQSNLNNLQPNSTMLQNQHLKQQEQQMFQSQQLKQQIQQRQMQQQQLLHRQQLMQQQQQQQAAQLSGHHMSPLHQMSDSSDMKMRQQMGVKPGVFQHSSAQRASYHHQQLKPGAPYSMTSPQVLQAASPQVPQHHSPQIDPQNLLSSITKTGTPLQSANSPFMPSPSTPMAPSPMPGESEKVNSGISSLSNAGNIAQPQTTAVSGPAQSLAIGTPGISASPLLAEFTSPDAAHGNASTVISSKLNAVEQPFERLIKAVKSVSRDALTASVSDISSVVSMVDRIAGSAPGNGSRAAVGEDLVAMTKCRLQARNFFTQDGTSGAKRMRRSTSAMPSNVVPSGGSINESGKLLNGSDTSEMESTATSSIKRPRNETNHALLEEIHEINRRLIDTVVDICDEDVDPTAIAAAAEGEGTIVKFSFTAVALSPNLKAQYASAQMSPIQPLRLLIPTNYPNCSPILLDKFPVEVSKEYEDLSIKAKSRFNISLRSLSQPMSLEEMAKTWDMCARAVISEYAQQSGGGTFSSKYGTWENCLSAS